MYDVTIVGARVAGSATAMLLARKGYTDEIPCQAVRKGLSVACSEGF
jgi:flavin-dependent dehydrogenase